MSPHFPYRAVLAAAFILGVSAALAWLAPRYISTETSHRMLGALLGSVVVVYANAIPKLLVRRQGGTAHQAADQAARRFAGWSMVLGGVGYMLAWLVAPIGSAALIGGSLLATCTLVALVRGLRVGSTRADG